MVVVVEDDDAIRGAVLEVFAAERIPAAGVATLADARSACASANDICVVLCDLHLDGENDARVRAFIEEIAASNVHRMLVFSAATDAESYARRLGCRFVGKPFDFDELIASVRAALRASVA